MLNVLSIENYQSLRKIRLELGRLTVITGATGAGKSAIIRAVRLLAFNAPGTSYISKGEKTCQVLVFDDSMHQGVAIARGGRGYDGYAISDPEDKGNERLFTKLGGQVPAEVTAWLGLSELNFATQFSPPFLLAESGSKVAAALGKLTNVTLLFSAAREANRRRLRTKDRLGDAQAEVQRLTAEIQRYAGLQGRSAAISQAEEAMARVEATEARYWRLGELQRNVSVAGYKAERIPAAAPLPSFERLDEMLARAGRLRLLLDSCDKLAASVQSLAAEEARQEQASREAGTRMQKVLADAGVCPLCGQDTRGIA